MQQPDKRRAGDPAGAPAGEILYVAPKAATEQGFAQVLAEIVRADRVSVDGNFFDDLGADSMVMARFCARVRKRADLPSVSMKDVYKHPTIRSLAAAVSDTPVTTVPPPAPPVSPAVKPASTAQYLFCGALQFLSLVVYFCVLAFILVRSYELVDVGSGHGKVILRSVIAGTTQFLAACTLPILVKWIFIGRWRPERIRIWSFKYVRFWFVKTVVQLNPVVLFAGTPIFVLYLRAMGAKIGRDAMIFSLHAPVCTDLLTIGERAIVRKEVHFNCYRANAGVIETGRVSLGKDSFVGEMAVLDIETSLGDGAQLGHSSALYAGQSIPDGERRLGCPARHRTEFDYRAVPGARCGRLRKAVYSFMELTSTLSLMSLAIAVAVVLFRQLAARPGVVAIGSGSLPGWTYVGFTVAFSFVLYFGAMLLGLVFVLTVPRLLNLAIKPDKVYPLYGFHYWAHRTIERLTNAPFLLRIFGDSSYVVHYLSWLGYDLKPVVQTGSNFGSMVKHTTPFLVKVGSGTMIADGLSMINADYSSTSFRVSQVTIGRENFLGNGLAYPSQGKTGDNCLLATKVLVPLDGDVREGIGLLGSPAFEIPRTVLRDSMYEVTGEERRRRLAAKNRHNLVTIGLFLLTQWIFTCGLFVVAGLGAATYPYLGEELAIALSFVPAILWRIFYSVLVERATTSFRDLQPQHCSIYDPYFWFHERYWKLTAEANKVGIINGTPLKGFLWRLLGARMGKRLFDDGCMLMEPTLVTVGDDCTLNAGSTIQPHSQEDGGFKSDRIKIGSGCTLGVAGWIHYGVTMGDGAQVAPDTFVMKGEEIPPNARWGENPARELPESPVAEVAVATAESLLPAASCGTTTLKGGRAA